MSKNNKQFKNTTAYKIIVIVLFILYLGYRVWAGSGEEQTANTNGISTEASERELSSLENSTEHEAEEIEIICTFRSDSLWESHYEKHGIEMGFADKEEYLQAANAVLVHSDTLHKTEAEDGDDVYYLEETNEFVVVSTDGYLRTYFNPSDGIDYYNRQ